MKLVITTDFFKSCRKTQKTLLEQMKETTLGDESEFLELEESSSDVNIINENEENLGKNF